MADYCLICGARIGDCNPDGIGAECRSALHLAQYEKWFSDPAHRLEYYNIEAQPIRAKFIELYSGVKFRSDFRRSFYQSICNSDRVSKKQLEIIEGMIIQKNADALRHVREDIVKTKEAYKDNIYLTVEVSRELIEIARRKIRERKK